MFGRDPMTPIAQLLEPKLRYYGEKGNFLQMDSLRRLYAVVAENVKKARDQQPQKAETPLKLKVNDLVMVKDPDAAVFQPRCQPNYRVTAIFGNNRIEVQDEKGHKSVRRSAHVKFIEPKAKMAAQLPSAETLKQFGRGAKLLITQKDIPHLQFQSEKEEETLEVDEVNIQDPRGLVFEVGNNEHSIPSRVTHSTDAEERTTDTGGDEHSTPSCANHSKDVIPMPRTDIKSMVQTSGVEGDDHSTPSMEQRDEREGKSTNSELVTKQAVIKEQKSTGKILKVSKLEWFGTQVSQFVETIAYTGNKAGTGGKANITNKCKNNTQSQSEFSFFL